MADSGQDIKRLHHAYLIVGNKDEYIDDVRRFVNSEFEVEIKANIDYFEIERENFSISDSRELAISASSKAVSNSARKIFVIFSERMTVEAQNSLLKTFEEPNKGIHFILVLRNENILLPTLRSRLSLVNIEHKEDVTRDGHEILNPQKFLKSKITERMMTVKKILDELDKDKIKTSEIHSFVSGMVYFCEKRIRENFKDKDAFSALETLIKINSYFYDRSASYKMLIEHLALTLPKIS